MAKEDFTIEFDQTNNSNIVVGTSAERAYEMWCEKQKQIDDLEYECELLVNKYHDEMCRSHIPPQFRADILEDMFGKDKELSRLSRKHFLTLCFSKGFLKKHNVEFVTHEVHGYGRTAMGVVLAIGDYQYTVEIPLPNNIVKSEDKERLMGQVKFRVDRIHKSKENDFLKKMESVQMPTYDWKKCFEAIEAIVETSQKQSKGTAVGIGLDISEKAKRMMEERNKKRRGVVSPTNHTSKKNDNEV